MDGSYSGMDGPRALGRAIALACLLAWLAFPATSDARSATQVRFEKEARSSFDPWVTDSNQRQRRWMRNHYWRVRGFAPFYDQALGWSSPAHFYQDAYAIYADEDSRRRFALKDEGGDPLYIPFACGGGCPQLAADFGNRTFQDQWIATARKRVDRGYRGIFIDDVNLEWRVSDRSGNFTNPIDPRTGRLMTLAAWRSYMADFMERVRNAFPNTEIVHNTLWWIDHDDPSLRRQTAAADFIQLERGYNDRGLVGGTSKYGLISFIRHIEWVHRQGASVILQPEDLTRKRAEYELAGYFLTKGRRDAIDSDWRSTKNDWWRGWQTDLGRPKARWYRWKGLLRRDYRRGMTLVSQPYSERRTVHLPRSKRFFDLHGKRVRRVTLEGAGGRVLTR